MKFGLILACGGKGKRLKEDVDKAFVKVAQLPLFYYSYRVFEGQRNISKIIIVARKKYFSLVKRYIKDERVIIKEGGSQRKVSVYNGLVSLDKDIDYVIIHDGARPFVDARMVNRLMKLVVRFKAVIFGLRAKDALKIVRGGFVERTINRENLYIIQTPQAFERNLLLKAYHRFEELFVWDDAQLIEFMGKPVKVIDGSIFNIKITYPEDLLLAKAILKSISNRKQMTEREKYLSVF